MSHQCDGAELHFLDETSAIPPAISGTWFVSLVTGLVRRRLLGVEVAEESEEGSESGGGGGSVAAAAATGMGMRAPASMAGGRRRKVGRTRGRQ